MTAERKLSSLEHLPAFCSREHEQIPKDEFKPWPNSLRGFLAKISTFPNGLGEFAPVGFELELNNGVIIDLPPDALGTVNHLKVGDQFDMMPARGLIEGRIETFDGVFINVSRIDMHQYSFETAYKYFLRKSLNPLPED